jgi:hypothetical protein
MGWFFRILIGIFWVGWFYFWIWGLGIVFFKKISSEFLEMLKIVKKICKKRGEAMV